MPTWVEIVVFTVQVERDGQCGQVCWDCNGVSPSSISEIDIYPRSVRSWPRMVWFVIALMIVGERGSVHVMSVLRHDDLIIRRSGT